MSTNRKLRIAINGFGRIGRAIAKINAKHEYFDLILINDTNPHIDNLAYLFRYDSTYGRFEGTVENTKEALIINGNRVVCTAHKHLQDVPWSDYKVDVVIDSSGVASNVKDARRLVKDGSVHKVVVTHSSNDVDHEVVMGVNDDTLTADHGVVSNSICDANAIAHIMKWLDDKYEIIGGALTTLHPWLSYQNLVDGPSVSQSSPGVIWSDYALGRASVDSLIPKNTTAMSATERVLPQLRDKILSFSYRIPTNIVASSDITLNVSRNLIEQELHDYLIDKCRCSPFVKANTESLVSLDYEQEEASAVLDMQWLKVKGNTVKVILWYDNEWGYSARVLDLVKKLGTI
jgi:glyceraldehyde 3-phosphate dehydrogenase